MCLKSPVFEYAKISLEACREAAVVVISGNGEIGGKG